MRIGDLAAATGTPVETIRYYEREGLLAAPRRTDNNYRIYTPAHAARLGFVRQCRALDMSLDEVRTLLDWQDRPRADCGEVHALLDEHIGHVAARLRELRALQTQLKVLRDGCERLAAGEACAVIGAIGAAAPTTKPPARPAHRHLRGTH